MRRTRRPAVGRLHDLLGRGGGPLSEAAAINDRGAVAGTAAGRAFLWQDGRWADLGPDDGGSQARGVDDDGSVVGVSWTTTRPPTATCWQGGQLRLLAGPQPHAAGYATAVAGGVVVGAVANRNAQGLVAVAWFEDTPVLLGDPGGCAGEALAVNRAGVIVGSDLDRDGRSHAFRWSDGQMSRLDSLGGRRSAATAVNDSGDIAGWSTTVDGRMRAVRWSADGSVRTLCPDDMGRSQASGLNAHGHVVGMYVPAGGDEPRAALWTGQGMHDLGTLGGTFSHARAVNDDVTVVGLASTGAGALGRSLRSGAWSWEAHAFRWSSPSGGVRRARWTWGTRSKER